MEEIAELLRNLIDEVRDLKSEIIALGGPAQHNLADVTAGIKELGDVVTGPLNYNIQDVMEKMHEIHLELIEKN